MKSEKHDAEKSNPQKLKSEKSAAGRKRSVSGRWVAQMGLYVAVALICSYIETLLPIQFGVPGIKLYRPFHRSPSFRCFVFFWRDLCLETLLVSCILCPEVS